MWPISDGGPPCSGVTVRVVRKPGTALGMSIAGGLGSIAFIGNDQVTCSNDGNTLVMAAMTMTAMIFTFVSSVQRHCHNCCRLCHQ